MIEETQKTETLESLKGKIFNNRGTFLAHDVGDEIQLVVQENRQRPGEPIFIREDGMIGFKTVNSISMNIGDVVKGQIRLNNDTVFFVEVNEIVERAPKAPETS